MVEGNSDSYSYLDQLSPPEVFQLLTRAAEKYNGLHLDRLGIVIPDITPFQFVALQIPEPANSETEYKDIFNSLTQAFKELTGRGELVHFPGGQSKPLIEGIAWLLLKSTAGTGEHVSTTAAGQYLMVSRHIDEIQAEVLFKNLNFHATSTRVTAVTSEERGHTRSRYMFHIKDDRQRKSSFQASVAGGVFKDCNILKGFEAEEQVLFLPPETVPGEQTLKQFLRLLQQAPRLFSRRERIENDDYNLAAAVVYWPETDEVEFWYLGGLRFFGEEQFTARRVDTASFQFFDLEASKTSLEKLGQSIKDAQPYVGYRLELRTTTHLDKNDLQRLNEQKARIDYNIAYLESISRPRFLLMRFTQQQLPVLAAEIRSFPIHVILDGSIKYGFQASESPSGGFHFILINPAEAARMELDPFPLWQDINVPHMRFRLDPFWANHYFDRRGPGEALVFVPDGCTIHPPLHAWDRTGMDQYLKETISHWFKSRAGEIVIPERPIYIFDGKPEMNGHITISVLDQDRMESLHTRLGWLNDNLLIHRYQEKESVINDIARDLSWLEMADKIRSKAESSRKEFESMAVEAAEHMAQTTAEMTSVLTGELNSVVRDSFRMVEKIKKLTHRLEEWDEVTNDMEMTLKEISQQKQSLLHQKNDKLNEFWKIEQEIQRELAVAEVRRKEMEEALEKEIKNMQVKNHQLKQRLKSFKL